MVRAFKYEDAVACFTNALQLHEVDKKYMHYNGNKNLSPMKHTNRLTYKRFYLWSQNVLIVHAQVDVPHEHNISHIMV